MTSSLSIIDTCQLVSSSIDDRHIGVMHKNNNEQDLLLGFLL